MRLDKYLKVSRLIKRRTVANEACDNQRVTVNGRVARASCDVKVGDVITLRPRSAESEMFKSLREGTTAVTPKWLTFDAPNLTGTVNALPAREDIDLQLQENMIVEFYSR